MLRTHHTRLAVATLCLVALQPAHQAWSDPKTAHPPRPATQADVDRLEKELAVQRATLAKLVKLNQQYLQQLSALLEAGADAPPPVVARPEPDEHPADSKPDPVAKPDPKPDPVAAKAAAAKPAKPDPKAKPTAGGMGTIVGRVNGGEPGNSFVYVEDIAGKPGPAASMKQENRQFAPRVLVVQKGTKVEFPNMDPVFHNVFSVTPGTTFDLGSYTQGESKAVTMDRIGAVSVYCNMHPQMVGYVLVVPSTLYARTGSDGFYRLTNVPAGHHRIVAWTPNSKPVTSEVDVADAEAVTAELQLQKGRQSPHLNKDNMPYGSYKD